MTSRRAKRKDEPGPGSLAPYPSKKIKNLIPKATPKDLVSIESSTGRREGADSHHISLQIFTNVHLQYLGHFKLMFCCQRHRPCLDLLPCPLSNYPVPGLPDSLPLTCHYQLHFSVSPASRLHSTKQNPD